MIQQDCFPASVLYCSLHRYDDCAFYPGSSDANYDMVGNNKGAGYNMNIAWNWVSLCVCVRACVRACVLCIYSIFAAPQIVPLCGTI